MLIGFDIGIIFCHGKKNLQGRTYLVRRLELLNQAQSLHTKQHWLLPAVKRLLNYFAKLSPRGENVWITRPAKRNTARCHPCKRFEQFSDILTFLKYI